MPPDPEDDLLDPENLGADDDQQPEDQPQDDQQDDQQDDDQQDDQQQQDDQPDDQQPEDQQERQQRGQDRQPSRGERRFATLTDRNRRLEQQVAETNRRLDELTRQQGQTRQAPQETAEQRQLRWATMTPAEVMDERLTAAETNFAHRLNALQFQSLDHADRTAFQARAAVDPIRKRWAPKVEAAVAEQRAKGFNVEREVILKYLLGEAMLAKAGSKEAKQERQRGEQRIRRQRTSAANGRSDAGEGRQRQGNSLERRLENVQI